MRRYATVLAAALLMGFQAAAPSLPPRLAALAEDAAAARAFDYMTLKAEGADLTMLSNAVYTRARAQGDQGRRCLSEAELELQSGLSAAAHAADAASFAADQVAADEALDKWSTFVADLTEGQPVAEPPFSHAAGRFQRAADIADPRLRELSIRTARDQTYRHAFSSGDQVWGALSPGARARVDSALSRMTCEIDGSNTAWLKADVAENGWFLISVHGESASGDAWLLTQHADRDRPFQSHVLALLEPLVATGETSPSNYAYLYDRVAVGSDRPQRYGTQGRCTAKNIWAPNDLEDPDRVEALRAEVDIGSLAEYQAHMHRYCADFTG
jgi:hypothetical protein